MWAHSDFLILLFDEEIDRKHRHTILQTLQLHTFCMLPNLNAPHREHEADPQTCPVVECADWTWKLVPEARASWTVVTNATDGSGVVQYDNVHGVVTEVAGGTCLTHRLCWLVLIGAVLATNLCPRTCWAVVPNWATAKKKIIMG